MEIFDNIKSLHGVSDKRGALYKKLGIETLHDLITHYPYDYIDYTEPVSVLDAEIGSYQVIKARVTKKIAPYFSKVSIFKALLTDEDDNVIICVFFNTVYSFDKLVVGGEYIFYGRISGTILQKEIISPQFININEGRLVPKYHLTAGLSRVMVSNNLKSALGVYNPDEILPQEIKEKYTLLDKKDAVNKIHFPKNKEEHLAAKRRLAFEELLVLQLGMMMIKNRTRKLTAVRMNNFKDEIESEFYKILPFLPTGAQKKAVLQCVNDMARKYPMNRLLQGDVGSGKTMVAAALIFFSYKNGYQSTFMAPTEILAKQHFATLEKFLVPFGIRLLLLTGTLGVKGKREAKMLIESGEADVIVGTQALIQADVKFQNLGLVVTDEQHRFGVNQRSDLISKGVNAHTLVMSATPIPRTLSLIMYGDLDVSILDELPSGRKPIRTYGVDSSYLPRLYKFIIKHVREGKQAYIVCPMISENENEKASAEKLYSELKESWFSDIAVGLLHGKMKQAEKDETMRLFKENIISVLISTTVIEVGVDVPNSVIMLIRNAEQFGLSQLHQLRGRVGRGAEESHCILVTDSKSAYTKARVDTMIRTTDGFEIANEDLKLRGPGEFFGQKQHGLPNLKVANMTEDTELVHEVNSCAAEIIGEDELLEKEIYVGLKREVDALFGDYENAFN